MLAEPFFTSESMSERPARRMLLLSYHFPPGQAVGALRWQKMARIAVERGWTLDVVTVDPSSLPSSALDGLRELPPGLRLYGVPQPKLVRERLEQWAWRVYSRMRTRRKSASPPSPANSPIATSAAPGPVAAESKWRLTSAADWKRAYYARLENARDRRWASAAAGLARRLVTRNRYAILVTCGPPHMVHWAGQRVAADAGIPFVMDLRDPWSLVERLADVVRKPRLVSPGPALRAGGRGRREPHRDEHRAGPRGDGPGLPASVRSDHDRHERIRRGPSWLPPPTDRNSSLMVFAGSIYLDRDPRFLLRAAARVVRELEAGSPELPNRVCRQCRQSRPGRSLLDRRARAGGGPRGYVGVSGFRPRGELAALLAKATMLVSLYQDSRMAIPSKIFDYMQYDAWILTFAEPGSATELVLRGSDADVVAPAGLREADPRAHPPLPAVQCR